MKTRVFEYRAWIKDAPEKPVQEVRRDMTLAYVLAGVLAILALTCLIVVSITRPLQLQLLAGLVVCAAASVMMVRKGQAKRAGLARSTGDSIAMQGAYPLSVSDTEIHFPESFDAPEDTWPLIGTGVEIQQIARKDVVVLTHRGRVARHFFATALADPVTAVKDEIDARLASATPTSEVAPPPDEPANGQQ